MRMAKAAMEALPESSRMAASSAPGIVTLFGRVLPASVALPRAPAAAAAERDRWAELLGVDGLSAAAAIALGYDDAAVAQFDLLVRQGAHGARAADAWAEER